MCVDGREKRLSSTSSSVDDTFTTWLKKHGILHRILNASTVLNLNIDDIRA